MKWTKIYWDQLKDGQAFRVRKYNQERSEEYVVVHNNPRKWEVTFQLWGDEDNLTKLCYTKMGGACEVLK